MAKTFKSLLSLLLAVMMVASLMVIPSSAASISLSKSSVTLTKGYQTTLSVSGTSSTVKWSTGDKSVATVTSKGKVVGKGVGTTYIYAKVSNSTLKCKVKVVAAKITASSSNVTLDEAGDTKTVTMTVKGSHSGLTVGSTDKSVASASWVRPISWDGNKIKIKITAKGEGEARIKVYLKKYPSTCYKYINVTVGDGVEAEEDILGDDTTSLAILPYTQNVSVGTGESYTLQVYSTDQSRLGYQLSSSTVASVTAGNANGNYRNYVIKGLSTGVATLRLYDKNDSTRYTDIKITVGSGEYYQLYTTKPTSTANVTDRVLTIQVNSTNYYMIVPQNYDPAYANTVVAKKFGKYSYYEVYDQVPVMNASGDRYYEFANTNTSYINPNYNSNAYYNTGTRRYILLPNDYDKVKLNTAVAKYNNEYEYFTVYNVQPTVKNSLYEYVETWTVYDSSAGKTISRYMLVNKNESNYASKVSEIISEDMNSTGTYSYYVVYSTRPSVGSNDMRIAWINNGAYKYMVVPATGYDVVKINDLIQKDTGIYEYNVMYSTKPTADSSLNEAVDVTNIGGTYRYVLYVNDSNATTNINKAYNGALADGIKNN